LSIHVFVAHWDEDNDIARVFKSVFDRKFSDVRFVNPAAAGLRDFRPGAAMVVLIDKEKLNGRRLEAPDGVRRAIARALERDVPVLPVYVGGMPAEWPDDIRDLSSRPGMVLRRPDTTTIQGIVFTRLQAWAIGRRIEAGLLPQRMAAWQIGLAAGAGAMVGMAGLVTLDGMAALQPPGDVRLRPELVRMQDAQEQQFKVITAGFGERMAAVEQKLVAAESAIDTMTKQLADERREREVLSQRLARASADGTLPGIPPPGFRRDIAVAIDGVHPEYSNDVVSRPVLSTLRGGIVPDIAGIRTDPAAGPSWRIVVLTVNGLAAGLAVGGQECRTPPSCTVKLVLRPWYVDLEAGDRDEPRIIAVPRLEGENENGFYTRLGLKEGTPPAIKGPGGYAVIHLLHNAFVPIDLKRASGDKAPNIDVMGGDDNVLRLVGDGRHWYIRLDQQRKQPALTAAAAAAGGQ
jgi:hypothetical protein